MSSVHNNSIETVNAAATAIVSAESRLQPTTVQKRRWGSCWSLYWCFGCHKKSKRISHAVLVPEPVVTGAAAPATENHTHSTAIVLPFIAPPSSPVSFLQSDPPSATQSPAGFLSLTSLSINAYSPGGPASIFAIGPYAHETQLVTPPVFSAFTTEPSTALCTPPPESVQLTTPSSPEVPFAQLLTSSLERARRNNGTNQKFSLSQYGFQSYQLYPGSPGGQLISPGSAISNSGTSSPFPDRRPILDLCMGEAPKLLGFEHFMTRKWGSRLGSGSLTPDGVGLGSRMGSGSLTPDGVGLSRLGSGSLTPDGVGPASRDGFIWESQISEASLANAENKSKSDEHITDHRVSFELSGEEVARCLANKSASSPRIVSESPQHILAGCQLQRDGKLPDSEKLIELCTTNSASELPEKTLGEVEEEHFYRKHRSITLGSIKEFNFDNIEGEVSDKLPSSSEWWANQKVVGKEARPFNNWTFFPMLQSELSKSDPNEDGWMDLLQRWRGPCLFPFD